MNTSSATIVLLPVAAIPVMSHVSSMRTSVNGTSARPTSGDPSSCSPSTTPIPLQSACREPVAYGHRPLTRSPPSTRCADVLGEKTAPEIALGF